MNHLIPLPGSFVPAWAKCKIPFGVPFSVVSLALFSSLLTVHAGEFFSNFNTGLPPNTKVHGHTQVAVKGGVDGTGVLQLTTARRNQLGSFIIDPLDGNAAVTGFSARFKALVGGGTGADGFGFLFGKDIPDQAFAEVGLGEGLIITFDTFNNMVGEITPGVRVRFKNKTIYNEGVPDLQMNQFVDVHIQFQDGVLSATYDGRTAISNLTLGAKSLSGRFALSSRTGGNADNHFIDDLKITTHVSYPFLKTFGPFGDNLAPDSAVEIVFRDFDKNVNPSTLRLVLDGREVRPQLVMNEEGAKVLRYQPPDLLKPGSSHTVLLAFVDRERPSINREVSYGFTVSSQIILSNNR